MTASEQRPGNNIPTGKNFISQLIKDPDRKSIIRIGYEFLFLFFYFRAFPRQYFSRYLFKKGKTNILDYYPWKYLYNIKAYFNEKEICEVLENKLYFDFYYRQFNISLPKILMYNFQNLFVVGENSIQIKNAREFGNLLEQIIKENSSDKSLIIKKTYWSYGGDKIFKIYLNQLTSNPELISNLYSTVIKSGYLFQETINQHPELNRLNPSCVNTIRFDTYTNPDGKTELISGYLRMSYRNAHIDNISSGGCMVGIDLKTGKLKKEGFSNLKDLGVNILTEHPVTKITFGNFFIPFFPQAKELVIKAAGYMPGLRLVGWDVAIGEKGPVLVEGNSDYDNTGNDLSEGGYRTNAIFQKVLQEYKILKRQKTRKKKKR